MENKPKNIALIGDVGGTNIRLQLISIDLNTDSPTLIKQDKLQTKDYDTFQLSVQAFLKGVQDYPTVAAVGIAGPIYSNTAKMANVGKWGLIDGNQLSKNLNISHFQLLNDFQAASYGILTIPQDQFVSINGFKADPTKVRGIMGPGTGLGNSVLYPIKKTNGQIQTVVIPSQGGHIDFPTIDQQTAEYVEFFKKEGNFNYISLERGFCGPSFKYMYKFFCQKYPQDKEAKEDIPTSQKIFQVAIAPNPPRIYDSVFKLFLKIYASAIAGFITQHITSGGMYLVNSITNVSLPRLVGTDMLADFKKRHPQVVHMVEEVPIMVCKVIEMGMKGAFYVARKHFINKQ